jgi:hypothetical protein
MADFIDVIHTNAKPLTVFGFGMMHAIGKLQGPLSARGW